MTAPAAPAPQAEPRRARRWLVEALPFFAMLLLLMAARDTLANHYQVPSGSMEPTLVPGDRVMVDMRAYGWRLPFTDIELHDGARPQPGDVVVFASPADGTRLIKRVVAVGGQTVALREGRLWVDGRPLAIEADEAKANAGSSAPPARGDTSHADSTPQEAERIGARIAHLNLRDGGGPDIAPVTVPAGMALVLGDHRGNSADGRFFGWVPLDALYGKAVAVYYRRGEGLGWNGL
jgi:signal peptidase I